MDSSRDSGETETTETRAAEVDKEAETVGCRLRARRGERDRLSERAARWIAAESRGQGGMLFSGGGSWLVCCDCRWRKMG
ncbi:hypothetical protein AMTR_s00054p00189020 [Amborella trichopoda]|uniref:Uncharacterized protein n=1 Tax=Amborella trichopoda TaxID=13333 RepID=U5D9T3_AMBTC|nr:hypothetical protein AMTR_s00054p00189020 [Amborella trichopoda]